MRASRRTLYLLIVVFALLTILFLPASLLLSRPHGVFLWLAIVASWWGLLRLSNRYRNLLHREWQEELLSLLAEQVGRRR